MYNNDLGGYKFGNDGNNNGYYITDSEGADTFYPFKNSNDIDAEFFSNWKMIYYNCVGCGNSSFGYDISDSGLFIAINACGGYGTCQAGESSIKFSSLSGEKIDISSYRSYSSGGFGDTGYKILVIITIFRLNGSVALRYYHPKQNNSYCTGILYKIE